MIPSIAAQFALTGPLVSHQEIQSGLINTSHLITCALPDGSHHRFVLQALNPKVFREPEKVMANILLVTTHLNRKNPSSPQLALIPTLTGEAWLSLPDQTIWRCYPYLEQTEFYDHISSPDLAYRAAAAFGRFQSKLSSLHPSTLHETIPSFHHTPTYFAKLLAVAEKDPHQRLASAKAEFDYIVSRKDLISLLADADLPLRITHNDTKISNILFPKDPSLKPIVIDLDTVMPGLALFDYGDLVRSAASTADENETDLGKIRLDPTIHQALTDGYLSTASAFLTSEERAHLHEAPKVITLELAIRFLTDHLQGDTYFKITHPAHNLERARNQLALLKSM